MARGKKDLGRFDDLLPGARVRELVPGVPTYVQSFFARELGFEETAVVINIAKLLASAGKAS